MLDARQAYAEAGRLFNEGAYAEAAETLRELNAKFPHNKNLMFALAQCLNRLEQYDQALALCDELTACLNHPQAAKLRHEILQHHPVAPLGAFVSDPHPPAGPFSHPISEQAIPPRELPTGGSGTRKRAAWCRSKAAIAGAAAFSILVAAIVCVAVARSSDSESADSSSQSKAVVDPSAPPDAAFSSSQAKAGVDPSASPAVAGGEEITNSIGMKLKLIHPGVFKMGSPETEAHRLDEPVREITITQPFYIGVYEVTQEQWAEVMGNNPSQFVGQQRPVEQVSWEDAQEFLKKLSEKEQATYRLPTEAEWEYACRAGTETPYYWGEAWSDEYGWCFKNAGDSTHDVGTKKPNAWGLYDMCGNVYEWCQDWHLDYPSTLKATDPQGPWKGFVRVMRGGPWTLVSGDYRSASRDCRLPHYRLNYIGFRVVREAEAPAARPAPAVDFGNATPEVAGGDEITNSIGMKLKLIHPGVFKMGSPETEAGRGDDETPVREITITQPFYIGVYEVTQEQWGWVTGYYPSTFGGKQRPVDKVSWEDVQAFLKKLSEKEQATYRLPTEAEWEYACRAGTQTPYYWGETWDDAYGWCGENDHGHDVGTKKPNAWGLYDMSGNVLEWCQDWYDKYPSTFEVTNPQGPSSGESRVMRGGSWGNDSETCRSANRGYSVPYDRASNVGFRVVRTP